MNNHFIKKLVCTRKSAFVEYTKDTLEKNRPKIQNRVFLEKTMHICEKKNHQY